MLIEQLGGKCVHCGALDRLEFDHIEPATKSFNISSGYHKKWAVLQEELSKCQLLCNSCHIAKTKIDLKKRPKNLCGGRPPTYPNLGDMMMTRMPTQYISQLRELLSELDRLGENNDPADILSNIIDRLSDMDS